MEIIAPTFALFSSFRVIVVSYISSAYGCVRRRDVLPAT